MVSESEIQAAITETLNLSKEQVKHRLELGDQVEQARQIDHFALFRSKNAAKACAEALTQSGFTIVQQRRRMFKFLIEFTSNSSVDMDSVNRFVPGVVRTVMENGGTYDGWSGFVINPEDDNT